MVFKIVRQLRQLGREVIVTDRPPSLLPDLFLRVQVGRGHRKFHDLQTRVGGQDLPDRFAPMPGGTIPKEQNGLSRKSVKELLQVVGTDCRIENGRTGHHFSPSFYIQGAIEANFAAPGIDLNDRRSWWWLADTSRLHPPSKSPFRVHPERCRSVFFDLHFKIDHLTLAP
jgi:hypothetical protein